MEISKKYLNKYLHDIAIEQLSTDYAERGYTVNKSERLGRYEADLVARRGNETIVIEVKTGKTTPDRKKKLAELANYVHSHGAYKFLVVVATPPKEKKLEIKDIESLIWQCFINDLPDELDQLSSHTRPEEISDIELDEIVISGENMITRGNGVIKVELQYGSDGDQNSGDGYKTYDSFPFEFEITLKYDNKKRLEIVEVGKLKVDTSSYYES